MSAPILDRLDQARGRLRMTLLATGLFTFLQIIIGVTAAFFIVDWLAINRILPLGIGDTIARLILVIAVLVVIGTSAARTVVSELKIFRDDDDIALRVEKSHRALGGRLISTVQLTRALDAGTTGSISSDMIVGLAEDTAERVVELDFLAIIDRRSIKRAAGWGLVCLVTAGLLVSWKPGHAIALIKRMALLPVDYPTATRILQVNHPTRIAEGETCIIEIEVDPAGVVPEKASVDVKLGNGRSVTIALERVEDAPFEKALFRGQVVQAMGDFSLRPIANDHRWPRWEEVSVVRRPAIAEVRVDCHYPPYLGLEDTQATVGDLRVPEGTEVRVVITTTKQLEQAGLIIRSGLADEATPVAGVIGEDGTTVTAAFTVAASGVWNVDLLDRDGLSPGTPPSYTITAILDRTPVVTVLSPRQDKLASPRARWPLTVSAQEDHGFGSARLMYQVETPNQPGEEPGPEPKAVAVALPGFAKPGEKSVEPTTTFDLSRLGVQPGQRVTYWIEVDDNKTPTPGTGTSQRQRFTILDPEALRAEAERQRAELADRINLIKERQKEARDGVDDLKNSVEK